MNVNIGKAVLYQMIGLQESHKSDLFENIDINKSGCKDCSWYRMAASENVSEKIKEKVRTQCANCPHKCVISNNTYINEKNKYGNKEKVCCNAIKLFILLHMQAPDQTGLVRNVNFADIAAKMNVNIKTIRNNLRVLEDAGYIFADAKSASVVLLDYPKYFLAANKGGRGYIKLLSDTVNSIVKINSITAFRIILRQLLEQDNDKTVTKTYHDIKRFLPDYCKRNIILSKLSAISEMIFDIKTTVTDITFKIKDKFNTKLQLDSEKKQHMEYFSSILESLDNYVWTYGQIIENKIPSDLKRFFVDENNIPVKEPVFFQRSDMDEALNDLALLSCRYSRNIVLQALADTYRIQMCTNRKLINNLGAYLSRVIKSYGLYDGKSKTINFSNISAETNLVTA